ncbi:DUF4232 domain-containing protein [Umezawaea sp. Da 62-37]|uniref:DUF4232 domain-containing protein n=1 Tax=Umezawaea sp. Da 62-37 TaxID=3075927 RepID=UPI0028F714D6|nr:DUF4232 domain-containing protein [Umezawaea sp. Da 62-37]WNV85731.1 DUF4232 domain-containing protein [Umezawaea sp. Da 62-37]
MSNRISAGVVLAVASTAVFAGVANAMPADVAACGAADVDVSITKSPEHAAAHSAFVVRYAAASDTTYCTLAGVPTDTVFFGPDGDTAPGIRTTPEQGATAKPVTVAPGHAAISYLVERTDEQANPVSALAFRLPSTAEDTEVRVQWPAEPVTGAELQSSPATAEN